MQVFPNILMPLKSREVFFFLLDVKHHSNFECKWGQSNVNTVVVKYIGGFEWIFINPLIKGSILIPDIRKQPQTSLESI